MKSPPFTSALQKTWTMEVVPFQQPPLRVTRTCTVGTVSIDAPLLEHLDVRLLRLNDWPPKPRATEPSPLSTEL